MSSDNFFFPVIGATPSFDGERCGSGGIYINKRKWETSTFDLASLEVNHTLHLPYQLMGVFLGTVNLEVEVLSASSINEAIDIACVFKCMLQIEGVSPLVLPFVTNYSINQYSGINSRDSKHLIENLPVGLREGATSDSNRIEAWPNELTFEVMPTDGVNHVTNEQVDAACVNVSRWLELEQKFKLLRPLRMAFAQAPQLRNKSSCLLHIWQAIEGVFSVSTEVSFRISLILALLNKPVRSKLETYKLSRKSYGKRSAAAHGNFEAVSTKDWNDVWRLVSDVMHSVLQRNSLPSWDELIEEILESDDSLEVD